jgi:glycosyltransferase involved in cell wall biosynthesis
MIIAPLRAAANVKFEEGCVGRWPTNDRLRVLIATQYYLPHRTGFTLHLQRVAEALAARGHGVTVVCARHDARTPRDEQVINGVRVIRLWAPLHISRGMIMPAYPLAAARLMRIHDVVSLHTPTLETALYAAYARWWRKGLVITHHGDLVLPAGRFNRFVETGVFQLYRLAAARAHRILAYSQDYADHSTYLRPYRDKTAIVYPPTCIPPPAVEAAARLREDLLAGTPPTARVVGFAGRFVEEKRPDVLIRALPLIQARYPGTRVVFAGQYDIRYEDFYRHNEQLIAQQREHLVFLGMLESEQALANFYAACDVLALPSDSECFALVQVEAMRCGTPVVATDIPGGRVPIRETGMGELVPPGDPQALACAILRVIEARAEYARPLAAIDAVFNFDATVDRYEQYLCAAAAAAVGGGTAWLR